MHEVNELWRSPWRKLQEKLANGSGTNGCGEALVITEFEVRGRAVSSDSWLARARMSNVDLTGDRRINALQSDWRQACEASSAARAQLQALAAIPKPNEFTLAKAHDRSKRAEVMKARILAKIAKLENANTRPP